VLVQTRNSPRTLLPLAWAERRPEPRPRRRIRIAWSQPVSSEVQAQRRARYPLAWASKSHARSPRRARGLCRRETANRPSGTNAPRPQSRAGFERHLRPNRLLMRAPTPRPSSLPRRRSQTTSCPDSAGQEVLEAGATRAVAPRTVESTHSLPGRRTGAASAMLNDAGTVSSEVIAPKGMG
jgi:hypothetical protein